MRSVYLRLWSQIICSTSTSTSTDDPTKWFKISFINSIAVEVEVESQI